MVNTPATQVGARSAPATSTNPSPSSSRPVSTTRGSPRMRHKATAPQGARLRVNQPSSSQAMVQLLEVIKGKQEKE